MRFCSCVRNQLHDCLTFVAGVSPYWLYCNHPSNPIPKHSLVRYCLQVQSYMFLQLVLAITAVEWRWIFGGRACILSFRFVTVCHIYPLHHHILSKQGLFNFVAHSQDPHALYTGPQLLLPLPLNSHLPPLTSLCSSDLFHGRLHQLCKIFNSEKDELNYLLLGQSIVNESGAHYLCIQHSTAWIISWHHSCGHWVPYLYYIWWPGQLTAPSSANSSIVEPNITCITCQL